MTPANKLTTLAMISSPVHKFLTITPLSTSPGKITTVPLLKIMQDVVQLAWDVDVQVDLVVHPVVAAQMIPRLVVTTSILRSGI